MKLVFYCYGVRLGWGVPPFTQELGQMFFQTPPQVGEMLQLRGSQPPTTICHVDHYHMTLDVTPIASSQPLDRRGLHSAN